MARFQFDQDNLKGTNDHMKSCAAVCCVATLAELGKLPKGAKLDTKNVLECYQQIQKAPKEISPAGSTALFLIAHDCQVEVLRNPVTKVLVQASKALETQYKEHKDELKDKGLKQTKINAFDKKAFDDNARVILVCIIHGQAAAHDILARKDGSDYYLMNPDGGNETKFSEKDLLAFMNTPAKVVKIGTVDYMFSGIALRVTV